MNNRYLYRAKRTDNGELVEGYYAFIDNHHYIYTGNLCNGGLYVVAERFEIDITTLCACTGLKDKNGKLIWENDIVSFQFDNDDCPFPNKDTKKRIGKVFFSDFRASRSIAMGKNGSKSLNNDLWKYVQNGNRVEVIGNIFYNPELLE